MKTCHAELTVGQTHVVTPDGCYRMDPPARASGMHLVSYHVFDQFAQALPIFGAGQRVRFARDYSAVVGNREGTIPAGHTGTVISADDDMVQVKIDQHCDILDGWENVLQFVDDTNITLDGIDREAARWRITSLMAKYLERI